VTTLRRLLPTGLGSLATLACLLCCAIPFLITAGVLGGAGWAAFGQVLPGIAVAFAALTALAWWWTRRRPTHAASCPGSDCSCPTS
jgi:mercuric ion transport protein